MPTVNYIQANGQAVQAEVKSGDTVKDGAVKSMVTGIMAECGGACMCATCHVYVHEDWRADVGEPSTEEIEVLGFADHVEDRSRLSCQISMSSELDGLVVYIPE